VKKYPSDISGLEVSRIFLGVATKLHLTAYSYCRRFFTGQCHQLTLSFRRPITIVNLAVCRDTKTGEAADPKKLVWFSSIVPELHILADHELPQDSEIAAGISYQTFCVSPNQFLTHRLQLCKELGAETKTRKVKSLGEVFEPDLCPDAAGVINCTGIGARELVPDDNVFPTKGQTIIVQGKAQKIAIRSGGKWENHVVPHPGSNTTLLSGCKLANDW
jgi:hypothetical protein